ncbi:MAG TPA: AI-2E family transporter [Sporichthyaceae bacterium]|nr:AI-2E family transporter [Sporichthyaceae bacterium]
MSQDVATNLPKVMRIGAAVSWRIVAIALALYVLGRVLSAMIDLVVPIAIAMLLAALLAPAVSRLNRCGVPRAFSTAIVVIGGLSLVGGLVAFVVTQFVDNLPDLRAQLSTAIAQIDHWLATGPLHMSGSALERWLQKAQDGIAGNQGAVASHVFDTAVAVGRLAACVALTIFSLIFFLHDGDHIWRFLCRVVPRDHRDRVDVAGRRGFTALGHYVRATVIVASIDALSIGIGLAIMGIPLAVPLATLIFLGAFVPILGAFVAGTIAVLVALVAKSLVTALVVLGLLIAVMQIEGHILQPLLLGRAVALHPLAVVLGIGTGLTLAGIPGALLAVPLLAILNASIRSLLSPADAATDPQSVDVNEPEDAAPPGTHPGAELTPEKPRREFSRLLKRD